MPRQPTRTTQRLVCTAAGMYGTSRTPGPSTIHTVVARMGRERLGRPHVVFARKPEKYPFPLDALPRSLLQPANTDSPPMFRAAFLAARKQTRQKVSTQPSEDLLS